MAGGNLRAQHLRLINRLQEIDDSDLLSRIERVLDDYLGGMDLRPLDDADMDDVLRGLLTCPVPSAE